MHSKKGSGAGGVSSMPHLRLNTPATAAASSSSSSRRKAPVETSRGGAMGFVAHIAVKVIRAFESVIVATGKSWPMTLAIIAVFVPILVGTVAIVWALLACLIVGILAFALILCGAIALGSVIVLPFLLLGLVIVAVTGGLCFALLVIWNLLLFPEAIADNAPVNLRAAAEGMSEEDIRSAIESWKRSIVHAVEMKSPQLGSISIPDNYRDILTPYADMARDALSRAGRRTPFGSAKSGNNVKND